MSKKRIRFPSSVTKGIVGVRNVSRSTVHFEKLVANEASVC